MHRRSNISDRQKGHPQWTHNAVTKQHTYECKKYRKHPFISTSDTTCKKDTVFYWMYCTLIIYLGQLCDGDCIVILYNNEINIIKYSMLILKVHRNKSDGLWDITISRPLRHIAHGNKTRDNTNTELIQYLYGCFFRPTTITFLKAIKNRNFLPCPGLNNQQLLNHIPPSIATVWGHLYQ